MSLLPFLALTFGISLAGFICILLIPAAKSPDAPAGLPFWLLTVWGPSLAAIILAQRDGALGALMGRMVQVSTVPVSVWLLVLMPIAILLMLRPQAPDAALPLGLGTALVMVGFNLILGPLGEELGWRGLMQHQLAPQLGWLSASLLVGLVWFIWHLPLWLVESPQAEIVLPLFGLHCMCYAVIIGAAYTLSGGSILPAILLHLSFNLAANWAIFAGYSQPNAWFSSSLSPYLALSAAAIALVLFKTGELGLRGSLP